MRYQSPTRDTQALRRAGYNALPACVNDIAVLGEARKARALPWTRQGPGPWPSFLPQEPQFRDVSPLHRAHAILIRPFPLGER